MSDLDQRAETHSAAVTKEQLESPPRELFVYYVRPAADTREFQGRRDYLGNWEEGGCSFLFFSSPARMAVESALLSQPGAELMQEHQLDYFDWLGGNPGTFVEGRVRVVPVWENSQSGPEEVELRLDPGVVFGAGNHPTTRLSLRLLDQLLAERVPATVLDLGSGSGLLALAAARLGAPRVLAVDYNPLAVRITRRNIHLNGLQHRVQAVRARAEELEVQADLVLANLHYDLLLEMAKNTDLLLSPRVLLAGVFPAQAQEIASILQRRGVSIGVEAGQDQGWPVMVGRDRS